MSIGTLFGLIFFFGLGTCALAAWVFLSQRRG